MLIACREHPGNLTPDVTEQATTFIGGPDASALADGLQKVWWQGDTLWFNVEKGLKEGYSKSFHPNGTVHRQGSFSKDLPDGWWKNSIALAT